MIDFLAIYGKNNREIDGGIISHFTGKKVEYATFAYKNAGYIVSQKRDRFFMFAVDDHAEKSLGRLEGEILSFFDGNITQDEFLTDISSLSPLLRSGETDHSEIFGIYCYGEVSKHGQNHIHRDVLGNYPLFIAYNDNLTAISNNPYFAAQALYGKDWQKYKNIYALSNVAMKGEIVDNEMTFKGVYYVPQNAGIEIDTKNNVSFYSLIENMYYPMTDEEWNGRLDAARGQMVKFLKSYTAGKIAGGNITGGFDSRVLLALTIEADIHKDVLYTILGYEDHPDVIIAKQIAQAFGLNLTRIETAVPASDKNVIPSSFEQTLRQYSSVAATIEFNEHWLGRIVGLWDFKQRKQEKTARNLLMGVAGEMFRGFYSPYFANKNIPNAKIGAPERELLMKDRNQNPQRFTQKGNEYFKKIYERLFNSFEDLYSNDLIYTRCRCLQFAAGLKRKNNNWFCAIGYNSWLHRLAMIQPPEKRVCSDIPFRLIEKSAPQLLYFPFDSKSWKYTAYAHRSDAERFTQINPVENSVNRPLPSGANAAAQIRFLLENNIGLDNSVFEVYDEKWVCSAIAEAKLQIGGKKPVSVWQLIPIINLYGASLFMQNKEGNLSAGCSAAAPLELNSVSKIKPLYTPNKNWYREPAQQVLQNGELCFERRKVFRQSDHNTLSDFEKFIFALDIKSSEQNTKLKEIENSRQWHINAKKKIEAEKNALAAECETLKSKLADTNALQLKQTNIKQKYKNHKIPKLLGKIICWFIPKRKNRHRFMKKHVKK
jgi:hypothetical protein